MRKEKNERTRKLNYIILGISLLYSVPYFFMIDFGVMLGFSLYTKVVCFVSGVLLLERMKKEKKI